MLLGIILFSLSKGFSLICWMRAFPIIHVINLCGEWTGLSFWAGTGNLGVYWACLSFGSGERACEPYFSNPISCPPALVYGIRGQGL